MLGTRNTAERDSATQRVPASRVVGGAGSRRQSVGTVCKISMSESSMLTGIIAQLTAAGASVGFARVRLGALGPDGEDRLAQHALSIRCLQRPDGSLARPGDEEADLVAVVARSY